MEDDHYMPIKKFLNSTPPLEISAQNRNQVGIKKRRRRTSVMELNLMRRLDLFADDNLQKIAHLLMHCL